MILVPAAVWLQAIEGITSTRAGVERVAYFDGAVTGDLGIVTTLAFPDAAESNSNFHVTSAAMSEAGAHLRIFGLRRLAQLHTHPDDWVGHSPYDDQHAVSQRDGMVSIIVPHHARCAPGLMDCGLHIREADGWRRLQPHEVGDVIVVVPSILDFRS